jgi:single-strand DNA-binding protein
MASLNKLIIEGKLTRDPETILANSVTICKFAIANNTVYYDTNKQKKEEVIFLDSVAFGKTAEEIAKWFTKGKPIILEGRLKTESWEKDGVKKSKSVLNVKDWYFHGGEKTEQTASISHPASSEPRPPAKDFEDNDSVPF